MRSDQVHSVRPCLRTEWTSSPDILPSWGAGAYSASTVSTASGRGSTLAFRWSRATGVEYLADPSGVTNGISVVGLNDDGSILAYTRQVTFIIEPSRTATILRPPLGYSHVEPRAMNQHGQVVGMVF